MQKSKVFDELNKLRSFVYCKTINLLRVQRANMCSAFDLFTASCVEAECLCIREVCSCIQRDVFLFSFLKIDEILNFDQSENVQETSILNSNIENESQS